MNIKKSLIASFVLLVLVFPLISANDVAYVYKNEKKVDQNILDFFNESNISYDLINENNLEITNLSEYGAIFIGKENLKNSQGLTNYPLILMNKFEAKNLGIAGKGLPKTSNEWKNTALRNEEKVELYVREEKRPRLKIPYYYIPEKIKDQNSITIVRTDERTIRDSGDIVSYIPKNSTLLNGETSNGNICFFGAIETTYWSPAAKSLFNDCVNFVLNKSNGIHDVALIDFYNSFGKIKLENSFSKDLTDETPVLSCNQDYIIKIEVENKGDFTENVSFKGSIGPLNFSHYTKNNLYSKDINQRSRTVNMSLPAGNYTIEVEAISLTDEDLSNNFASRNIIIYC